jgi:alpha,alpha-trehalose phosphorylase
VLPLLALTHPQAVADALIWRHSTLDLARARARQFNLQGAVFPWRTINGEECSGYWPAGTAAFHINADIAYAVAYYVECTDDRAFEEQVGLELLAETARLWYSLGYFNGALFYIDGVTGPDEYSAIVDNNVYTNLMAQRNLRAAAAAAVRHAKKAKALGIKHEEIVGWRDAADKMFIPYDKEQHVTSQDDAFTRHEKWNFATTTKDQYPLFLHFHYFDIYRKQVIKQADLVLAMQLCDEAFTQEQKQQNFAYYEPLTVRDSSLSAPAQAALAAEVGQLELAYDYLSETIFMDLDDLEHNVKDGLHIASLAGGWMALIGGFGGLRLHGDTLSFKPRIPPEIERLSFHITFHGCHLRIDVMETDVTYRILGGQHCKTPLKIEHHGEKIELTLHKAVTRPIPAIKAGPRPSQPSGRAPIARHKRSTVHPKSH